MNTLNFIPKHNPIVPGVRAQPELASTGFRVMCATDLWARSERALQKALWLAEVTDAQLLLLHVVDGEMPLRIAGRRADLARGALQWRVRHAQPFKPRPAISVRLGNPQRTILRVAREWRADLVVLGATRRRIADRFVGTTAERLAIDARCAALVVNRGEAEAYSDAAVIAASCCDAAVLEDAASKLRVLKRGAPIQRVYPLNAPRRTRRSPIPACGSGYSCVGNTRTHASVRTAAEEVLRAPPHVVVVEVDRWPGLSGFFRHGASSMVARSTVVDVLVAPRRTGVPSRQFDACAICKQ
jgi:nucleotide-binding universal stress UspA family protein